MKHLFLPKNVRKFVFSPFDQSPVEEFEVDEENKYFCSRDGVIFSKDMKTLIAYPQYKNVTSYIVPSTVETIGQTSMTRFVYLERIVIPDSVTEIKGSFLYTTKDKIKEVIILRSYRQKNPKFILENSFVSSNFKLENITYIVSTQIPISCKFQLRFSIMTSCLYVFILL